MLMCNVSSQFKSVYGTQEAIIKKGIATEKEMEKISKKDDTSMAWLDKWWVPLNWCCHKIRVELEADGHLSGYVNRNFCWLGIAKKIIQFNFHLYLY